MFSRSGDTSAPPVASKSPAASRAAVTDAMRAAPTFTAYDLTVHLQPGTASLEAEARVTLRNDGSDPLRTLPLQLSSSLHFEQIRSEGKPLAFTAHRIDSDADHTGALTEAAVALPAPLAPGAAITLTADYAGTIEVSSGRLDRAQASATLARQTDWDRIGDGFTSLRGFGNTVWYPVASVPALLGDGDQLLREVQRQKARNSDAMVAIAATVEFTTDAPDVSVLEGVRIPTPAPASLPTAAFSGVLRLALPATRLGFQVPSLLLATRTPAASTPLVAVEALPEHAETEQNYTAAARLLDPLLRDWFGRAPAVPLALVDLPVDDALPFDEGDALLLSLKPDQQASRLAGALVEPLTHVYFRSPRPWLREGVAGLMAFLWTERTDGRDNAVAQLESARPALALAEPGTPGESQGQPLITAQNPVFFRTKAVYVLAMLRVLVGDDALRAALRAYDPAKDAAPDYFEQLVTSAAAAHPPPPTSEPGAETLGLHAFFQNWVYEDRGLPDLAITNVFSSRTGAGDQWLVAVTAANTGYAPAQVPLAVHSGAAVVTIQLLLPARASISHRILLQGQPTEVDLNDGTVPELQAAAHQRLIQ